MHGGRVNAIALDDRSPGPTTTAYAATDGGLFKLSGGTWSQIGVPGTAGGIGDLQVTSAAVDTRSVTKNPNNTPDLYVATGKTGYWKSINGGATWAQLPFGGGGSQSPPIVPDSTVAGGGTIYFAEGGGVGLTTDGGNTANVYNQNFPPNSASVSGIALDYVHKRIYVTLGSPFNGGQTGAVLGASTDASVPATFMKFSTLTGPPGASQMLSIRYADKTDTLYVGTDQGFFSMTNPAKPVSWSGPATGLKNGANSVTAITIDPANPGTIYILNTNPQNNFGSNFISKSTNSGATFAEADSGIPQLADSLTSLVLDPNSSGNVLYLGHPSSGVFKSTNAGQAWSQSSTGLDEGVVNWLATDPNNSNHVYATVDNQIYSSTDGGATWSPPSGAAPIASLPGLGILFGITVDTAGTVFVGGLDNQFHGGLFRSTDKGANWTLLNSNGAPLNVASILPVTSGSLLLVGQLAGNGLVYASTDGGTTFNSYVVDAANTNNQVLDIAIDPVTPSTAYAVVIDKNGKDTGVWVTSDGGISWVGSIAGIPTGIKGEPAKSLAVDGNHNVYFCSKNTGIFKKANGNPSFVAVSNNLPIGTTVRAVSWAGGAGTSATIFIVAQLQNGNGGGNNVIYVTKDGASSPQTWQQASIGLPTDGRDVEADKFGYGQGKPNVFAGTSAGVYKSTTGGQ